MRLAFMSWISCAKQKNTSQRDTGNLVKGRHKRLSLIYTSTVCTLQLYGECIAYLITCVNTEHTYIDTCTYFKTRWHICFEKELSVFVCLLQLKDVSVTTVLHYAFFLPQSGGQLCVCVCVVKE